MRDDKTCVSLASGKNACWGPGPPAFVDDGTMLDMTLGDPVEVRRRLPDGAKASVHGAAHECFSMRNAEVDCTGDNAFGQLGDGTHNPSKELVIVHGLADVAEVVAGAHHTCARLGNGTVSCWGKNDRHQLSSGTTEASSRPVPIVGLIGVRELAAAGDATCAVLGDGDVRCWGANDRGQLGDARRPDHEVPASVRLPH
jgi:alpha-tubulin suppressor-like RCC1 family protein